jgi:hypothetical protein
MYKLWCSSLCSPLWACHFLLFYNHIISSVSSSQTPWIYVLSLVWGIKFHTHTKQQVNNSFTNFNLLSFWRGYGKTKDYELNDNKHSSNLIYSYFLRECNFYFLLLSLNIQTLPHFLSICLLSLNYDFVLHLVMRLKLYTWFSLHLLPDQFLYQCLI